MSSLFSRVAPHQTYDAQMVGYTPTTPGSTQDQNHWKMESPHGWHDLKEEVVPQDLLYRTPYRYQSFRVRVTEWDIVYVRPRFYLPYVESEVFLDFRRCDDLIARPTGTTSRAAS